MSPYMKLIFGPMFDEHFIGFNVKETVSLPSEILLKIKKINSILRKLGTIGNYFYSTVGVRIKKPWHTYMNASPEEAYKVKKMQQLLKEAEKEAEKIGYKMGLNNYVKLKNILYAYKVFIMELEYQTIYLEENKKLLNEYMDYNYMENFGTGELLCRN